MTADRHGAAVTEELRHRAGTFVDGHAGSWVTVGDDGTLTLAGERQPSLVRAAAEWLEEDPTYTVVDVRLDHQAGEPTWTLGLRLHHAGSDGPSPT
ncbi:hypothetical protein [Streptantibioticus ferralitis]|uniref:Uncharacterized protein n=1 Tax=Streptantibioticus ferralitis TaxID=236510 RepID=A0ABT5Z8Q5_9ACTN|nr:hypothetical protein [Streptantibioticus ferralitis]MDF2260216.1 hypothetical protein [Streptantibioticus ferralitis]